MEEVCHQLIVYCTIMHEYICLARAPKIIALCPKSMPGVEPSLSIDRD